VSGRGCEALSSYKKKPRGVIGKGAQKKIAKLAKKLRPNCTTLQKPGIWLQEARSGRRHGGMETVGTTFDFRKQPRDQPGLRFYFVRYFKLKCLPLML